MTDNDVILDVIMFDIRDIMADITDVIIRNNQIIMRVIIR